MRRSVTATWLVPTTRRSSDLRCCPSTRGFCRSCLHPSRACQRRCLSRSSMQITRRQLRRLEFSVARLLHFGSSPSCARCRGAPSRLAFSLSKNAGVMSKFVPWIVLSCAIVLIPSASLAQHEHPPAKPQPPTVDQHQHPSPSNVSPAAPLAREGSGTSWLPEAT